jgi:5-methylthioribose kinase
LSQVLPAEFADWIRALGLSSTTSLRGEPLAGGVSSDIWRVDLASGPVCVKRALPVLKVKAHWQAPIVRNQYEARWMRFAASVVPGAVPECLASDSERGMLLMQYLPSAEYPLWKERLRDGTIRDEDAAGVGTMLGAIHARSAAQPELAAQFESDTIFHAIRLDPYLGAAAKQNPDCALVLEQLIQTTASTRVALVHGDVSPKNILIGPTCPVLLDAECAWWGDPAFDLAFCLNHLLLKRAWRPHWTNRYQQTFKTLLDAYRGAVLQWGPWEPWEKLEARCARLLPALLLARVDGKSPVEYLDPNDQSGGQRDQIRTLARRYLRHPTTRLEAINQGWDHEYNHFHSGPAGLG